MEQQIELLGTSFPNAIQFNKYLKDHWLLKVKMWCVGNQNIPHARQDMNSSVESFQNNMKRILYSSRERFTKCKMD
jgi:hypothetical protein